MPNDDRHLSDQEMLLAADGELSTRRAAQVRAHLAACSGCRSRMSELDGAIAAFAQAHRQTLNPRLPSISGPRALLRARLNERALAGGPGQRPLQFRAAVLRWAPAFCIAVLALAGIWAYRSRASGHAPMARFGPASVPNPRLTPGAFRATPLSEVCSEFEKDPTWRLPVDLKEAALREYGISGRQSRDYQIDFLIPPSLGGTEELYNVWPEPSSQTLWNARAKDALEDRLHQLVCGGELSLSDAQHEIASDWVSAYKRYFKTNRPEAFESAPEYPKTYYPLELIPALARSSQLTLARV